MKIAGLLLAFVSVMVVGLMVLAGGGQTHASGNSGIASGFGVKESAAHGDLFVHVTVAVPPGVDQSAAISAALAAQGARPATPDDLGSADYTTTGLIWDQFNDASPGNDFVTQYFNPSGQPSGADGQAALTNTHSTWNAVATSSFVFSFGGLTNRCPSLVDECPGAQSYDGFNDVQFMSLSGPCNAFLGCTLGVTWYSTSVDEADMALNTKVGWIHNCSNAGSAFDDETVMLHENGHVLGLGHSEVTAAVMAPYYDGPQCQLHPDDIAGVSVLYPASGASATPTPTPTPAPTPATTPTPAPTATPSPDPGGTVASVSDIGYSTSGGRFGDSHMTVTISVVDDGGQPVAGASVSADIKLDGSLYASRSGTSGSDGTVALKVNNAPSGCYATVVTTLDAAGLTWDGSYADPGFAKGSAVC